MANLTIQNVTRICCIGATKVGVVSTVVAAEYWPTKDFVIVDDQPIIDRWTQVNNPRYFEPNLQQLIATRNNVTFQPPDFVNQIRNAQIIIIAVDVTTKKDGVGKRKRLELEKWDKVMRIVLAEANRRKCIIIKSVLPPDNAIKALTNIVDELAPMNQLASAHHIFWIPEFFSAGTAVDNVRHPERVVITPCLPRLLPNMTLVQNYYLIPPNWVANNQIITTTTSSAMLGVMMTNAMLAIKNILINSLTHFCETIPDANIIGTRTVLVADERISEEQFNVSAGVGGPGLLRDIAYFSYMAELHHNKPLVQLLDSAIKCNLEHQGRIVAEILQSVNALPEKIICILGFSYKENTSEVINSAAIEICNRILLEERTLIRIYDPRVHPNNIMGCFPPKYTRVNGGRISVYSNLNNMWHGAHVICLLQPWPEFNHLNWQQIYNRVHLHVLLRHKKVLHIFDLCNVLQNQAQQFQQLQQINATRLRFRIHRLGHHTTQ